MKNSEYWETRIANNTWNTYNTLEGRNRALLEMYQEASLSISDELYRVAEKLKTSTPMLSDMHKLNRLSKLQKNMENNIRKLGENVETFGRENMMEGFKNTYSNVMAEIGATEFDMVPEKVMKEMLDRPWEGSNFSTRLWKNTQVLSTNLNDIITNGLTQGKTITEMAIQLNNAMNKGFNVSHRLVRTETMHYLNESAFKGYVDAGCDEVQLWAAVDERLCDRCGPKHGNIYKIKNRPILPLHANCRCTYLPVIDDEAKKDHKVAKDNIEKEWDRRNIPEEQIKDKMKRNQEKDKDLYKKYKGVIGEEVPKSFEKFQELKYNRSSEWNTLKANYRKINHYNKIIENEPGITKDLMDISLNTNTNIVGLEYRLKTKESYLRKVNSDSRNSLDLQVIDDTISNTNDVIRYTYQNNGEILSISHRNIDKMLLDKGYGKIKTKNFWNNKLSAYKGVNCIYRSPRGQNFEVQFHTPESFELKNGELHKLYEEMRLDDTSELRKNEISKKMFELSSKLKRPKNIELIK